MTHALINFQCEVFLNYFWRYTFILFNFKNHIFARKTGVIHTESAPKMVLHKWQTLSKIKRSCRLILL